MDDASFRALLAYNWETKLLDDVYRSAVKKCGLPECAFWILYTLRMEPDSFTQARICEFLREPKQTVNSALKKLEAGGYLTLSPGADQRSKPVRLTDSGLPEAEAEALRRMTPEECERFIQLMARFRTLFETVLRETDTSAESKI